MNVGDRVYLNGRLIARDAALISAFDRGFLYGDGFFETTRIHQGVPLLLARHLRRLADSCRETGFGGELDLEELKAAVSGLVEENAVAEGYLRITVSRGRYEGRLAELATEEPTVLIEARGLDLAPLEAPPLLVLARSPYRRNEGSPLVRHKSLSYQLNVLALADARRRGADEALFLNSRGELTEGAISNLFLVKDGAVLTPDVSCGLLPGITRRTVLELCQQERLVALVDAYEERDLRAADEVFCTNSLRGVMPVGSLLDWPDVALASRPVTERLQKAYVEFVTDPGAGTWWPGRACTPGAS
ncbi:MAG: aminotransferase class IV [Planctomycetota bacterium]|jgi:branched-subunit amino acid aminotransferase/4-amino-4-deoxychorismate lyase